jgi:hypothetical protein
MPMRLSATKVRFTSLASRVDIRCTAISPTRERREISRMPRSTLND